MKKQIFLLCIVAALIFSACGGSSTPADVLSPKAMQAVLWDIAQADVFASDFIAKDTAVNDTAENLKLQQQIFMLHHTTRDIYYKSFEYYKLRPELMKGILDSITAMVNQKKRNFAPPAPTAPAMHGMDSVSKRDTTFNPVALDTIMRRRSAIVPPIKKRPALDTGFRQKKTY